MGGELRLGAGRQPRRRPGRLVPAARPACPAGPPRPRPGAEDQPHLALEGGIPDPLAEAMRPARARLTSHLVPATRKGDRPGAVGAGASPEHIGQYRHPPGTPEPDTPAKTGTTRSVTNLAPPLNR